MYNIKNIEELEKWLINIKELKDTPPDQIIIVLGAGFDKDTYKKSYTWQEYNKKLLEQFDKKELPTSIYKCLVGENEGITLEWHEFIKKINPKFFATYIDKKVDLKSINNNEVITEPITRNQFLTKPLYNNNKNKEREFNKKISGADIRIIGNTHINIATTNYSLPDEFRENKTTIDKTSNKNQSEQKWGKNIVFFHGNNDSESNKLIYTFDDYQKHYVDKTKYIEKNKIKEIITKYFSNNKLEKNGDVIQEFKNEISKCLMYPKEPAKKIKFMFLFGVSGLDYPFMKHIFELYDADYIYFFNVLNINEEEMIAFEEILTTTYNLQKHFIQLVSYNKDEIRIINIIKKILEKCSVFKPIYLSDNDWKKTINNIKIKHPEDWIDETFKYWKEIDANVYQLSNHIANLLVDINDLKKSKIMNEFKLNILNAKLIKITLQKNLNNDLSEKIIKYYWKLLINLRIFWIDPNIVEILESIKNKTKNIKIITNIYLILILHNVYTNNCDYTQYEITPNEFERVMSLYYKNKIYNQNYVWKDNYFIINFTNILEIKKSISAYYKSNENVSDATNIIMGHISNFIFKSLTESIKRFYDKYDDDLEKIWRELKELSKDDHNFIKWVFWTRITLNNQKLIKNGNTINISTIWNNRNVKKLSQALRFLPIRKIKMDIKNEFKELLHQPEQHWKYGILTQNKKWQNKWLENIDNGNSTIERYPELKAKLKNAIHNWDANKIIWVKNQMFAFLNGTYSTQNFKNMYKYDNEHGFLRWELLEVYQNWQNKKNTMNFDKEWTNIFTLVEHANINELKKRERDWKKDKKNSFYKFAKRLIYDAYDNKERWSLPDLLEYIDYKNSSTITKQPSYEVFFEEKYAKNNHVFWDEYDTIHKYFDIWKKNIFSYENYSDNKITFKKILNALNISSELFKKILQIKYSSWTHKDNFSYCIRIIEKIKKMDEELFAWWVLFFNVSIVRKNLKKMFTTFQKINNDKKLTISGDEKQPLTIYERKQFIIELFEYNNKIQDLITKTNFVEDILIYSLDNKNKHIDLENADFSEMDLNSRLLLEKDRLLKIPNNIFTKIIEQSNNLSNSLIPILKYTDKWIYLQDMEQIKKKIENKKINCNDWEIYEYKKENKNTKNKLLETYELIHRK